ncbi:MAG TPA: hypothetical protein DEQ23_00255 [Chlorobium sp.]|nr:hypothetical protein [Chlorobium sp.]
MKIALFLALVVLFPARLLLAEPAEESPSSPTQFASSPLDLRVAPSYVLFEDGVRATEISLINSSNHKLTYALSFKRMRMLEDGDIVSIHEPRPGEQFADEMVRFTPRRVVLLPRQIQTVRLRAMRPATLQDGEYRSFLNLAVVPNAQEALPVDEKQPTTGLKINLTPVYGVAIPVVVRKGKLDLAVRLVGLKVVEDAKRGQLLSMTIERDGKRSSAGILEVEWDAPGTKRVQVARVAGVSVMAPLAKRNILLKLRHPEGIGLRHGTLKVRYLDSVDRHVLAEGQLIL